MEYSKRYHSSKSFSYLNKIYVQLRKLGYEITHRTTWYDNTQTWEFTRINN